MTFIPLVNTCSAERVPLSTWRDMGFTQLAYQLTPFLIKPGWEVLQQFSSLAHYLGWSDALVLDVTDLGDLSSTSTVVLTSPFDGSKIRLPTEKIQHIISCLNVEEVSSVDRRNPDVSEEPLLLATQGGYFENQQKRDIQSAQHRMVFQTLQDSCSCPTCRLGLTKAYLHHLWFNVPTLCQRYLVQHNSMQFSVLSG